MNYVNYQNSEKPRSADSIDVFPNPTDLGRFVVAGLEEGSQVTLMTITGQELDQILTTEVSLTVQIPSGYKGLLIVQIRTIDGVVSTKKVIAR